MKRRLLLVLSLVVVVGTTYSQNSADTRNPLSGGFLGAVNLSEFRIAQDNPTNLDYDSKAGFSLGAWLNLPISSGFSIEPQVMYSKYRYMANATTPVFLNDGKISYISIPLLLKFNARGIFAITVGPQVDFVSSVEDKANLVKESDLNKTSFSLTGGVEIAPRGPLTIFARYLHGLSDMNERDQTTNMEYRNQVFQLGLKMRLFGGTKKVVETVNVVETAPVVAIPDRDGDGINDQLDKCPDVFGLAKYEGCPIPDSDKDGINDELDKCPNQAGTAKYEGCPIPDTDGDGINDELDKCPTQAGTADRNGCPVPDSDNDGINDDLDKCPDIAGVANNKGCPEVPANVSKSIGSMGQNISFGAKDAKLTTKSNTSLNRLVTIMNENPGLRIRIEGHTDNVGDEDANEELSEERAKAVQAYLVSKGIDEGRITTEGFGGTQPIMDNKTAAGRTKNRRIEIRADY